MDGNGCRRHGMVVDTKETRRYGDAMTLCGEDRVELLGFCFL